jgi:hypothetical protein
MKITLDLAQSVLGTATSQTVLDVIDAVDQRNSAVALETLRRAVDPEPIRTWLARSEYLRGLLLCSCDPVDGGGGGTIREHIFRRLRFCLGMLHDEGLQCGGDRHPRRLAAVALPELATPRH